MSIIKKIVEFIRNRFYRNCDIKVLDEGSKNINTEKNNDFLESLKVNNVVINKNKEIETLICIGDGLGIKNKINY